MAVSSPKRGKQPCPVSVISATRLHFPEGTAAIPEVSVQHLKSYAVSTRNLGIAATVAVNCLQAEVTKIIAEAAPGVDVKVLHVPVWGAFVPALNTLLGEAQRRSIKYILYQSLEVLCTPSVLTKLLDHFTPDTLVVGPVLDGHVFEAGEQPLNGQTTPWNTLALWSTRKLGLTGFLNIADGMPDQVRRLSRQLSCDPLEAIRHLSSGSFALGECESPTMGSAAWWEGNVDGAGMQASDQGAVPAGVEEVTAIALLQHLLGESRARAVLILLPQEPDSRVSWKATWEGDQRRKEWHDYKMRSKVARPAAQAEQLFGNRRRAWLPSLQLPLLPHSRSGSLSRHPQDQEQDPQLSFGVVQHFGESIRPAWKVEMICLASVALFSANFASAFPAAFQYFNEQRALQAQASTHVVTFVSLVIGGVYLPMPLSLLLTRLVTSRGDHVAGLALSAGLLALTHSSTVLLQVNGVVHSSQHAFFLATRLLQGLGSGVLFQARFVLASMSTQDHHLELQTRTFFCGDLGLSVGVLLPCVASALAGSDNLSRTRPELLSSAVLAVFSLALFVWILAAFPQRLYRLPDKVRFPVKDSQGPQGAETTSGAWTRLALWASGTMRVFVQSAAIVAMALRMQDAGLTASFRQSKAVAAMCLLPAAFEAMASGICRPSWLPKPERLARAAAVSTVGVVVAICVCTTWVGWLRAVDAEARAAVAALELAVLLMALAFAAPLNVSRLNQHQAAEQSMVMLEWLKAYVGRLCGPIFALAVQNWLGYGPLLGMLCSTTVAVALTA